MTKYERLEALYATLPTVNCQRRCQDYCGPILIPKIEARRLEEKRGYLATESGFKGAKRAALPAPEIIEREFVGLQPTGMQSRLCESEPRRDLRCVFLAPPKIGTCMAYGIRPLVCRLWSRWIMST